MSKPIISVENLSKAYHLGQQEESSETLMGAATYLMKAPLRNLHRLRRLNRFGMSGEETDTLWALKDVSFEVQEGEVVGIIGRNGAGKSTLLKILSRITEPTSGRAVLRGRVASLLEVGTGFHPELTGRENIYMNGTILGMTKREIDRKFDEIVDFSGVEKFLDTPIKHYSSGMTVRLAFAVAAHLEPEILIIDEVLAVGDAEFQKKCIGKMEAAARGGRTVLFVSHNLSALQSLCTRGILLAKGKFSSIGSIDGIIQAYIDSSSQGELVPLRDAIHREGDGRVKLTGCRISVPGGPQHIGRCGAPLRVEIDFESNSDPQNVTISLGFINSSGQRIAWLGNSVTDEQFDQIPQQGRFICTIPKLTLRPGIYTLNLQCSAERAVADWLKDAFRFEVVDGDFFGTGEMLPRNWGVVAIDHAWSLGGPSQVIAADTRTGHEFSI